MSVTFKKEKQTKTLVEARQRSKQRSTNLKRYEWNKNCGEETEKRQQGHELVLIERHFQLVICGRE
jgi:hypothetical protein